MTIRDLLKITSFDEVKEKIFLHYGDNNLSKYGQLYNELKNISPVNDLKENVYIYITAYIENEEEDIPVKEFNEDDISLYYDVSAYESYDKTVYSIASSSYSNLVEYNIDNSTLKLYSYPTILAHCLWEVTFYGFEDNL